MNETSSMFELDNVKNEAILRDVFMFQSLQHQKRSNSMRLLQFSNLTTSITLLRVIPTMTFQNSLLTPLLSEAFVTGLLPN